jgi:hypothetical protein
VFPRRFRRPFRARQPSGSKWIIGYPLGFSALIVLTR